MNKDQPYPDADYLARKRSIETDERYPPGLKTWALAKLSEVYVEKNGKQPPESQEPPKEL